MIDLTHPLIRRCAALGLLAAIGFCAVLAGLTLSAGFTDRRAMIAARQATLDQMRTLAEQADAVEIWASGLTTASLGGAGLLTGQTHPLVSAELQSRLAAAAAQNGLQLTSFRALEPSEDADLVNVGVALDAQGGLVGIRAFIEQMEQGSPQLVITKAELRAGYADPSNPGEVSLSVGLEAHGWWRPPAEPIVGDDP